MVQKFLLLCILAVLGVCVFFIVKLQNTVSLLVSPEMENEAPVPSPSVVKPLTNIEMPKIWSEVLDKNKNKIFLSYESSLDTKAKELIPNIEKNGTGSVFTPTEEMPMTKLSSETLKALNAMDLFIILYSSSYPKDVLANQEYGFALSRKIPIITIVMNEEDLSAALMYGTDIIKLTPENTPMISSEILEVFEKRQNQIAEQVIKIDDIKNPEI
jgi:hypothetical protein